LLHRSARRSGEQSWLIFFAQCAHPADAARDLHLSFNARIALITWAGRNLYFDLPVPLAFLVKEYQTIKLRGFRVMLRVSRCASCECELAVNGAKIKADKDPKGQQDVLTGALSVLKKPSPTSDMGVRSRLEKTS
jgi:hypothetical protein